ncbi:MAG: glycosyltransferase family 2 protein [Oscillospiraceae bacterium]|nr:glycosyltransferase family 2 protein [Oscillospiraceae bacterium]
MEICAGIVLYNPDLDKLDKNINAAINQVSKLIIVDNNSDNINQIKEKYNNAKIIWITNDENKGMSVALNQMIEYANDNNFEWLLTLDDDSVCGENMVALLLTALTHYGNIAVMSPRILDACGNSEAIQNDKKLNDFIEINMCITAGSLINVKAVIKTDGFDERLFIDHVDHDMCLRLRRNGYKIIKVNKAVIYQTFGNEYVSRRFLWKTYTQRGYSPIRVYYQTRNSLYMIRKYGKEFDSRPIYFYFYLIFAFIARFIYEPNRIKRFVAFVKGYFSGLFMKIN